MAKRGNTRDRTTNWSYHNASLKRRGSLSIWFDPNMSWQADRSGKRGHPEAFSDRAIRACLTLKILFGLPLRQTVGLVASLIEMAGLDRPCARLFDAMPASGALRNPIAPPQSHETKSRERRGVWAGPFGRNGRDITREVVSKHR